MALHRLEWHPGFNSQQTQTQNKSGWFAGNLVRWRNGLLEKVAGWLQLFATPCAATVRRLHAFYDLFNTNNLLIGTATGAQLYRNGSLQTFTFGSHTGLSSAVTFTPTIGVKTIAVHDVGHNGTTGNTLTLPMTIAVGGKIILGGSTFTITVVDANNYTFDMAANATTAALGVPPVFAIDTSSGVTVTLTAHGLSVGQPFVAQEATSAVGSGGTLFIAPGSYTVTQVLSANTFNIAFSLGGFVGHFSLTEGSSFNFFTGNSSTGPVTQIALPLSSTPTTWSLSNLGNNGILNPQLGPIYIYSPPSTAAANAGPTTAPQINTGCFVAMPQAQIIAYGSETTIAGGVQDPLLVRWSDAGSYSVWTASSTNQAGSFRLGSSGTRIVGGIQAPQTSLLFTDNDVWSMQYVGTPLIYSFQTVATGCGLIAQYARAVLGRTTLWVTSKGFFIFADSGVRPLLCPVWDIMFNDLDPDNTSKIFCGANVSPNEIWVFYPSLSGGTGECDKYLKYNIIEDLWDFGSLDRTTWIEDNAFGPPLAADENKIIQQHEIGYDDNGAAMAGVYAETGYADLSDGETIGFVNEFIPDMKWFGDNGAVSVSLYGVNYPGETPQVSGPFPLDSTNRHFRPHFRARQIALRFDWYERAGFSARLGVPRARVSASGRRP